MSNGRVSISIVSHRQGALVGNLLSDLREHCRNPFEVILTLNVKEELPFDVEKPGFPIKVIHNEARKGFAANHNAAFHSARADYFCVLNPDIRLERDPFSSLIGHLSDPAIGVAGPLIVNSSGKTEDSARKFPTPASLLRKALSGARGLDYPIGEAPVFPDWIAGMFMLFRSEVFRSIGGFDEGYFLYYEDVDLCWRLRRDGHQVVLVPAARAVHDARRESHHNPRYLFWHITSLLRFLRKRMR